MPGLFGTVGCPRPDFETLGEHFRDAWDDSNCESWFMEGCGLGGHALGNGRAVHDLPGLCVAVDGAAGVYETARRWRENDGEPIFTLTGGILALHPRFVGNVAALEAESGTLHLASGWAGAFPLFYTSWKGGLVFASLVRPLARLTRADIDVLGLLQFLRQGYVFGNRTPFRDIYRLRPGEVTRFERTERPLARWDRSRLWVGEPVPLEDRTIHRCLQHLTRALGSTLDVTEPALMMSGGWDSRTLLAAFGASEYGRSGTRIRGYSHGDLESRELSLVRSLCREAGVPLHLEPIDERVLDPESLRRDFARTGTANFSHWHRSGHVLRQLRADCAVAGVFGEILGGHYGRTMAARGLGKGLALAREWLGGQDGRAAGDPVEATWKSLRLESVAANEHWYLDTDFEQSIAHKRDRINAELRTALVRLNERGITRPERLLEACISEHRGSQYIAAQTVSVRTAVNACLPFADRELLHLASRIPARDKVHNTVNRAMLRRLDSPLLDQPMAATLVPAAAPIPLQEASRAIRKIWESLGWKGSFLTGRRIPPPRLSWVNFEFLRDGEALHALLDDLHGDLWDRTALRNQVEALTSGDYRGSLHPLFDQLSKVVTADRLLR